MLRNTDTNAHMPVGKVRKFPAKKKSGKTFLWNPPKPTFDFTRPQSWSSLSCFSNPDYPEYSDPEKWYQRYVLKIKEPLNAQLIFGSKIDKLIQDDPKFLPDLERFPDMQFKMNPTYKKIPLIGFADGWDEVNLRLKDDKTGATPWTQERADKTGQLTMYCMMLFLQFGIKPEKIKFQIDWMETYKKADGTMDFVPGMKVKTFYTKRTAGDVMKFMNYVEKTYKEMQEYVKNHK